LVFAYTWEYENVREIKNSKQPRLLIISDSFGAALFPFLSENFSRTVKIFDAWQYKLNEDIVNSEKPDAVVLVIDEPILRNFIKNIPKERLP
jgi:alginate O-acetyltransferase complex protein AlgJ